MREIKIDRSGKIYNKASLLRIVVLGYIVRGPLGGLVWHHLQYVMGLAKLGHDVYFIEDSDDYPSCYDPTRHITDTDPTYGLSFAKKTFEGVGLKERWAYHDAHTDQWFGLSENNILKILKDADLLINLSGVNPIRPWLHHIPIRVFVDTDPVFTQIKHHNDPSARTLTLLHTSYFSFGENIGQRGCTIPQDGFKWIPTRQPVVMDAWEMTPGPMEGKFTTVMQWDSYPPVEHHGNNYGMKSTSFQPYFELPERTEMALELAVGSQSAPRDLLRSNGWNLRDPLEVTKDPWTYQRYIQESKAEFTVAKHGYVISRSGWFSERSAAYLASGRPVVTQETGFSDWMETGTGIISFNTPDEAVAGIEEIDSRYESHCRSAREIAEEYFDSRKVLPQLIESATSTSQKN